MSSSARRSSKGSLSLLVVGLLLIGIAYAQRFAIYDWFRLRNYQPSAAIVGLVTDTTMTSRAQHLFYINWPALEDKDDFNQSCPNNGGEQTIILGCYHGNQAGIYLFNVSDPQLNGVEQVTASHEMLHAAYQRLSSNQKREVDALLLAQYKHITDQRILANMAIYNKTEPNALVDEMHSIFGTEVADLSPALEAYYGQYFSNRSKIIAFAAAYQGAFTSRQAQVTRYDSQLATLKASITANEAELDSQSASIDAQRQQLDDLLTAGDSAAYNARVAGFNNSVIQYNKLVETTKNQINQYNSVVELRNTIALEEQNLAQELNSNAKTQAAQ